MSYTLTVGSFKLTIAQTRKVTFYVDTDFQAISAEANTAAAVYEGLENKLYKNPADAISNGIAVGDLWAASSNNTMGAIPGTLIVRIE